MFFMVKGDCADAVVEHKNFILPGLGAGQLQCLNFIYVADPVAIGISLFNSTEIQRVFF